MGLDAKLEYVHRNFFWKGICNYSYAITDLPIGLLRTGQTQLGYQEGPNIAGGVMDLSDQSYTAFFPLDLKIRN